MRKTLLPVLVALALVPGLARAQIANAAGAGLPAYATDNATAAITFPSSTFSITDSSSEVYACFCQSSSVTNLTTNPLTCTGGGGASGLTFETIPGHLTALGQDAPSPNFTGAVACAKATASSAITDGTVTCSFSGAGQWIPRSVVVFAKTGASATIGAHDGVDNESATVPNAISLTTTGSTGSVAVAMGCGGPSAVTAPTYLAGSTAITAWGNVTAGTEGTNYTNWIVESTGLAAGAHTLGTSAPNSAGVVVAFEIQAAAGGQAATPTSAPGAGTYTSAQSVTLACTSPSPTILYCTDTGGTCTPATTYTGAFTVSSTAHVRALCQSAGLTDSAVMDNLYTIQICATPTFSGDQPGTHASAPWTNITLATTTGSCAIHYTTTGVDPTSSDATYSTALSAASTTTVKAIATATGWGNSGVLTGTFTVGSSSGTSGWWSRLYRRFLPGRVALAYANAPAPGR